MMVNAFGYCRRFKTASALAHLARRFSRRDDGAAAVEFALVFVPFIVLLFAIIETAFVFVAQESLETDVADAARLIMTGQAQQAGWSQEDFKNRVCPPGQTQGVFNCDNLYVDVQTYASFSQMNQPLPSADASGKYNTAYQPGVGGSIVLVRLIYRLPLLSLNLPFFDNSINLNLTTAGTNYRVLVASAAFCNEPYTGTVSSSGCSAGSGADT